MWILLSVDKMFHINGINIGYYVTFFFQKQLTQVFVNVTYAVSAEVQGFVS